MDRAANEEKGIGPEGHATKMRTMRLSISFHAHSFAIYALA